MFYGILETLRDMYATPRLNLSCHADFPGFSGFLEFLNRLIEVFPRLIGKRLREWVLTFFHQS